MPVLVENLDRDIAIIKKRRGNNALRMGDEQPFVKKIPLDSPGLMRITSGGIPLGRMTRLWGSPSSGKTLCALSIVKSAQKMRNLQFMSGLKCAYWNVEGAFDKVFAETLGVDVPNLVIEEADIIEDIGRELSLLMGSVHLHVIDSCSDGKSQDRLARDVGDWEMAGKIRAWEKSFEYIMNAMDKDENVLVTVDHESKDFKTHAAKALGGKEMEHESSLSIHFKKGKWLYYDEHELLQTEDKLKEKSIMGIAGQKEADGVEILVNVNKSRVCRPLRKTVMRLDLNHLKFDHMFELMNAAEYFDKQGNLAHRSGQPPIAIKSASWFTLPDGEKVQGERALRQRISEDEDLQTMIRTAMLAGN